MKRYTDLAEVPADLGPTVVTLGNFDGVHLGHQKVLRQLVATAQEEGLRSVAISFDPHPASVHSPAGDHVEIMSQDERQQLMEDLGVDVYLLLTYTLDFAAQTPEEFMRRTFVQGLNARFVVIGDDVRFGVGNSGDLNTMKDLGCQLGFEVVVVDDLLVDKTERCSSTVIRQLLAKGKVEGAAALLSRYHAMTGEVVHGAARGRELGFPTANMAADSEGLIPADGVYAGWLTDQEGSRHPVAVSVGTNPTFEGVSTRQVEAHVVGRPQEAVEDFNLYGQRVRLEFVKYLRPMVAYTGPQALIDQISQDVALTKEVLGLNSSQR